MWWKTQSLGGGVTLYACESCGKTYEKQVVTDVFAQLGKLLNEQKQEAVANLRRQLWQEIHAENINSEKIVGLSRKIKEYLPDDYFANFCEIANSGNDKEVNDFLNSTSEDDMADYADIVLDFMMKSLREANISSVSLFIENAYKHDSKNHEKYNTALQSEAEKLNSGIYELSLTRDVFIAYSSADIDEVLDLCDYLERQNLTCFLALRNLRHGRGAVDNYDQALKTAIDNCKTVVFVSSTHSRSLSCDALRIELPYIKQKDREAAPAEYRHDYEQMPAEYKMPRVQYLIEEYKNNNNAAERSTTEFFYGLEWCKSKEEVCDRLIKYLTETHETSAQRASRQAQEHQQQLEEMQQKLKSMAMESAAPVKTSVQSLLKRAQQELATCDFDKARDVYNRIVDSNPECADAWYGLILAEMECTSDEELLNKFKKTDSTKERSYKFLFKFKNSHSAKLLQQCATADLQKRYNELQEACDNKICELGKKVQKGAEGFYKKILSEKINVDIPIKGYAGIALLLLENDCTSDKKLIEKFAEAKINNPSSYACLFTFKNSEYRKQLIKTSDDDLANRYKAMEEACDKKIAELCATIDFDAESFYSCIAAENIEVSSSVRDFAAYALLLIDNKCSSAKDLIKKINACDDSNEGLQNLSEIKNSYYNGKFNEEGIQDPEVKGNVSAIKQALDDRVNRAVSKINEGQERLNNEVNSIELHVKAHKGSYLKRVSEPDGPYGPFDVLSDLADETPFWVVFVILCVIGVGTAVALYALTCCNGAWLIDNAGSFGFLNGAISFLGKVFNTFGERWTYMMQNFAEAEMLSKVLYGATYVGLVLGYLLVLIVYILIIAIIYIILALIAYLVYLIVMAVLYIRYSRRERLAVQYNRLTQSLQMARAKAAQYSSQYEEILNSLNN